MNTLLLVIIIVAVLIMFYEHYKKRHVEDIFIAEHTPRKDLYYGYYATDQGSVEETKDHINLLWENQFGSIDTVVNNIQQTKVFTILDLSPQLFKKVADKGKNYVYNEVADAQLKRLFQYLQDKNVLQYVKAFSPIDEPNTNVATPEDLNKAIESISRVAVNFPELNGYKLVCIYAAKPQSYTLSEKFDWIGFDDYDNKSQIFINGQYEYLKSILHTNQRTIIMPGGAFGQNITPFINFANGNAEVAAIVPFVWFGPREHRDTWVGIRDRENRQQYVDAGIKITK